MSAPGSATPPTDPAVFDAAWRRLVLVWPNSGEIEIGPVVDVATEAMARVVQDLIVANPALCEYVCAELAELPNLAGARILPLAALSVEIELAVKHGVKPWQAEAAAR